jgi:hypothetical protein
MDTQVTTYVAAVLALYQRLPDVVTRPRRQDRQLALDLHRRGVPLALIETALAIATARRGAPPDAAAPRSPVRSLHYYLPVIEELLTAPPADGYLDYLRDHLADPAPGERPENDVFR